MATVQDVAKAAGVSVATVSRVINKSSSVTEEKRIKVLDAIKRLNYQPNLVGRNLRRAETKMILVLVPNFSNYLFGEIFQGIEQVASENGYKVIVCPTDMNHDKEKELLNLARNRLVDGVIFCSSMLEDDEFLELSNICPFVICGSKYNGRLKITNICINDKKAAFDAVSHLIQLGHKKIGMISSSFSTYSILQREEGYKEAIEKANIVYNDAYIKYGAYDYDNGINITKQFLCMKDRPTALFCASDVLAVGCVNEVKANGFKVPEDVAVIGFDNTQITIMCTPPVTTISQPRYTLGYESMKLLLLSIKGETIPVNNVILNHELVIRQSTVI